MREKLIELIGKAQDCGCDVTDVVEMNYVENITLADHLIAHGVTIQRWIPVTERLPEKNTDVLAYRGNHIGDLMDVYTYKGDDEWDDTYGNRQYTEDEGITHWMPLPEPPKGE